MTNRLTLADVLARGIPINWHEAIAIVRGAAEALNAFPAGLVPELQQIAISGEGQVEVGGGTPTPEPVRRVGQLLQALLSRADPPVQLRLTISQATAPLPSYSSLQQLDDALAYFERPGRPSIVAAVYHRAIAAPERPQAVSMPTLDAMAPLLDDDQPAEERAEAHATKKGHGEYIAAAVGVLVLAGVLAAVFLNRSEPRSSPKLADFAGRVTARVGDSIINGISFVTERVGLGRLVSADEGAATVPAPVAPAASPSPQKPVAANPGRRANDVSPAAPVHASSPKGPSAGLAPIASARPQALAALVPMPGSDRPFAAFDLEPLPGSDRRSSDAETIYVTVGRLPRHQPSADDPMYSVASEGVTPPVALRPQLPRELPPTTRRSDLRQIDLVISPAGTVESVKLVGVPRNVHDSMLLSAVKAWEFIPALKDGVAVRYRKTITVAPRD
jgi:hypothetical protein